MGKYRVSKINEPSVSAQKEFNNKNDAIDYAIKASSNDKNHSYVVEEFDGNDYHDQYYFKEGIQTGSFDV